MVFDTNIHTATMSFSDQFYIELGQKFLLLSGVPKATEIDGALSKLQICLTTFCLVIHVLVSASSLYSLSSACVKNYSLVCLYHTITLDEFYVGNLLTTTVLVYNYKELGKIFHELRSLIRQFKKLSNKRRPKRKLKLFLGILFIVISIYDSGSNNYKYLNMLDVKTDLSVLALLQVLLTPSNFLFWGVSYNLMLCYAMEVEFVEILENQMMLVPKFECLNTVLPVVEEHYLSLNQPYNKYTTISSSHYTTWYSRLNNYREASKNHILVKNIRMRTNRIFYFHLVLFVFFNACYFPILTVVPFLSSQNEYNNIFQRCFYGITICVYILSEYGPAFFNQWYKYRNSRMVQQISKEVYTTSDIRYRCLIKRFIDIGKDSFSESHCVMFDFEASIWPTMIDTAALIALTILAPQQ